LSGSLGSVGLELLARAASPLFQIARFLLNPVRSPNCEIFGGRDKQTSFAHNLPDKAVIVGDDGNAGRQGLRHGERLGFMRVKRGKEEIVQLGPEGIALPSLQQTPDEQRGTELGTGLVYQLAGGRIA